MSRGMTLIGHLNKRLLSRRKRKEVFIIWNNQTITERK